MDLTLHRRWQVAHHQFSAKFTAFVKLGWVLEEQLAASISSTAVSFTASNVNVLGLTASKIKADMVFSPSIGVQFVEVELDTQEFSRELQAAAKLFLGPLHKVTAYVRKKQSDIQTKNNQVKKWLDKRESALAAEKQNCYKYTDITANKKLKKKQCEYKWDWHSSEPTGFWHAIDDARYYGYEICMKTGEVEEYIERYACDVALETEQLAFTIINDLRKLVDNCVVDIENVVDKFLSQVMYASPRHNCFDVVYVVHTLNCPSPSLQVNDAVKWLSGHGTITKVGFKAHLDKGKKDMVTVLLHPASYDYLILL